MSPIPDAITKLRERISTELGAEVEIDSAAESHDYTLWVVSPKFAALSHLQRQDLVWGIVDQVCSREEAMMITLIMTFAPGEIDQFVDSLGAKK